MKEIGAITIGKLIEAHYEQDEHKFKAYAEFIAEAYKERGEERAERIIRSKIDGSYKNKPVVVTLDYGSENITNPFESLRNVVAFSCRDWSAEPEDAWIYGIIAGWGFDEDDGGKSCTDELERKFGSNKWSKSDTKRLKVLHNNWKLAKELFELFLEGHCQDKNRHENFRKKKENLIIRIIRKVKK